MRVGVGENNLPSTLDSEILRPFQTHFLTASVSPLLEPAHILGAGSPNGHRPREGPGGRRTCPSLSASASQAELSLPQAAGSDQLSTPPTLPSLLLCSCTRLNATFCP